jgi:hypothetical protein
VHLYNHLHNKNTGLFCCHKVPHANPLLSHSLPRPNLSAKQWFVLHHCNFVIMCYTNGTVFWDWFGSFNKMPWRSIYVVLLSSYCWDNSFYINSWLNHRKHLGCFQFCNITKKKPATNIAYQFLCDRSFHFPRTNIQECNWVDGEYMFNCTRNHPFFKIVVPFYILLPVDERSSSPTSLSALGVISIFHCSHSHRCVMGAYPGCSSHFPNGLMILDVYPYAYFNLYIFFDDCPSVSFVLFPYWIFWSFTVKFKEFFILAMQVLCQIYDLQIFFLVIGLSFHHLNRVIHSTKVLHFYEGCFNSSFSSLSVSYQKLLI